MASFNTTVGYFDFDDTTNHDQISMEFEWLDENGGYTKEDPADAFRITSSSFCTVGNGVASGYSIASTGSWVIADEIPSPMSEKMDEVLDVLRQIQDRLLVIEEKDDEYFKDKAALKKAYDKFRMLEALCRKKEDE